MILATKTHNMLESTPSVPAVPGGLGIWEGYARESPSQHQELKEPQQLEHTRDCANSSVHTQPLGMWS